jgi:hypothetical protein
MKQSSNLFFRLLKGQIKPKADWRAIDSLKKRTKRICFLFFAMKSREAKKKSFVPFLEEFTARLSAYSFI